MRSRWLLLRSSSRMPWPGKTLAVVVGLLLGLTGTGCTGGGGGGEGPGHRPQRLALSPNQELELGRQAAKEVLANPDKFGRVVPPDRPVSQRVQGIFDRLKQATTIEPLMREMNLRQRYPFEWRVWVLDKDVINAFCLPGGKMFVFRGIIPVAQNDDQLATVISHEMAHALAHHASERVARQEMNHSVLGGIWSKHYDREQEAEADHIGLFLMTFAGYDPEEAVRFWERMARATGGGRLPQILSDHPSDASRIKNMQAWVPRARAAKRAYEQGNIAPAPRR